MAASPVDDLDRSRPISFETRVEQVEFDKSLINQAIMEYFVRTGYPDAARCFAREANIEPRWDSTIKERVAIRECIFSGRIQEAIERINDLDPEEPDEKKTYFSPQNDRSSFTMILDRKKSLHFALLRLQLIELIRPAMKNPDDDMLPALKFAEENLAPIAPTSPEHLRDLEETMTLLIFQPGKVHSSLAHLLEPDLKRSVYEEVNLAVLESAGGVVRNKLHELVKIREWTENKTRSAKRDIPAKIDVGLDPSRSDDDSIMHLDGNGHSENVAMS